MLVSSFRLRLVADYGGALSAGLCLLHCAAGPLLLAWWGGRPARREGADDLLFLGLSAGLLVLVTRRLSSPRLRGALWAGLGLFAATVLLADRYPWLEYAQYGASLGLLAAHMLNLLICSICGTAAAAWFRRPANQPRPNAPLCKILFNKLVCVFRPLLP